MTMKTYTKEELKAALENEKLNDEQLDGVAGGSYDESYADMMYLRGLYKIPFDPDNRDNAVNKLAELYRRAGTGFDAHNSDDHPNRYWDGYGRPVSRETAVYDLACKIADGRVYIGDLMY